MRNINRREFIGGALAGSAALLAPRGARADDARVEILVGEQTGTVAPEIYSHFIEHLGGIIYDGVWVGEGSKIPNVGGVRAALVEHMRRSKPAVARWPGGCFSPEDYAAEFRKFVACVPRYGLKLNFVAARPSTRAGAAC